MKIISITQAAQHNCAMKPGHPCQGATCMAWMAETKPVKRESAESLPGGGGRLVVRTIDEPTGRGWCGWMSGK